MVVYHTDWLGLAKPTEDELAKNWVNNLDHVEANNSLLAYVMGYTVTPYTPTLIAATTQPTLGGGSIKGAYCDMQGIVFGDFVVEFLDPSIVPGVGEYGISLPFPVDESFHVVGINLSVNSAQYSIIGEGFIYDATSYNTSGSVALSVVTLDTVTYYARMVSETYGTPVKTSRIVREGQPFTVAHTDKFSGHFIYKRSY